jgi:hypothetical protein
MLIEGWAEPVDSLEPALIVPLEDLPSPSDQTRELFPPRNKTPEDTATDGGRPKPRRPRSRKN